MGTCGNIYESSIQGNFKDRNNESIAMNFFSTEEHPAKANNLAANNYNGKPEWMTMSHTNLGWKTNNNQAAQNELKEKSKDLRCILFIYIKK